MRSQRIDDVELCYVLCIAPVLKWEYDAVFDILYKKVCGQRIEISREFVMTMSSDWESAMDVLLMIEGTLALGFGEHKEAYYRTDTGKWYLLDDLQQMVNEEKGNKE